MDIASSLPSSFPAKPLSRSFPSFPFLHQQSLLHCSANRSPARRNYTTSYSGEKKKSGLRRKGRALRPAKTDQELCDELREFISAMGLPEDHVPTTKELTENGRKDLANIVRRRGYKAITGLLRISTTNDCHSDKASDGHHDFRNIIDHEHAVQDKTVSGSFGCILSNEPIQEKKIMFYSNGALLTTDHAHACEIAESSTNTLQFKSAKFVNSGEMDDIDSEDTNFDSDMASKVQHQDNQKEIDRLKILLHEKEMELSQLKQLIEDEKLALDSLQADAKSKISNVQRAMSEKDMELRKAQEKLNELKEVRIEYLANGHVVEVAGSFNGWQHRVKMDMDPSSEPQNPAGARKRLLWSTVLWLYPGVYEIKFIVDGHWRIDPEREIVTSGNITNNVLRVDR